MMNALQRRLLKHLQAGNTVALEAISSLQTREPIILSAFSGSPKVHVSGGHDTAVTLGEATESDYDIRVVEIDGLFAISLVSSGSACRSLGQSQPMALPAIDEQLLPFRFTADETMTTCKPVEHVGPFVTYNNLYDLMVDTVVRIVGCCGDNDVVSIGVLVSKNTVLVSPHANAHKHLRIDAPFEAALIATKDACIFTFDTHVDDGRANVVPTLAQVPVGAAFASLSYLAVGAEPVAILTTGHIAAVTEDRLVLNGTVLPGCSGAPVFAALSTPSGPQWMCVAFVSSVVFSELSSVVDAANLPSRQSPFKPFDVTLQGTAQADHTDAIKGLAAANLANASPSLAFALRSSATCDGELDDSLLVVRRKAATDSKKAEHGWVPKGSFANINVQLAQDPDRYHVIRGDHACKHFGRGRGSYWDLAVMGEACVLRQETTVMHAASRFLRLVRREDTDQVRRSIVRASFRRGTDVYVECTSDIGRTLDGKATCFVKVDQYDAAGEHPYPISEVEYERDKKKSRS